MQDFNKYLEVNLPGGQIHDRSLEGFKTILDQLRMQMKSVLDPNAKRELQQIVAHFTEEMFHVLSKYHAQGTGFSPRYEPTNHPF